MNQKYSIFTRLTIDPCGQCWGNISVIVQLIDDPNLATITPATLMVAVDVAGVIVTRSGSSISFTITLVLPQHCPQGSTVNLLNRKIILKHLLLWKDACVYHLCYRFQTF